VAKGVSLGAGEVLVTSIDQEGTRKGFDDELTNSISKLVNVPIIASGGYGQVEHLSRIVESGADAVAFADAIHYGRTTLPLLRQYAAEQEYQVRKV
jgi:cyclase